MENENHGKTEKKVWLYRDGTVVIAAILLVGFALQAATGGVILRFAGFPWNLLGGILFCILLCAGYFVGRNHRLIKWLGSVKAALPAILGFTFLVLLMGFVKQDVPPRNRMSEMFGLTHLVRTWPFILINAYLLILLGVVALKRLRPFNLKNAGFLLNHFGLFLVLFSTSLGSGDMKRLTMNCYEGRTETRATDESGREVDAPFSVRLIKFRIDEFRPKVAVVERNAGTTASGKVKAKFALLDGKSFELGSYHVDLEQFLDSAAREGEAFCSSTEQGAAPAARLNVINRDNQSQYSGWVATGRYNQSPVVLPLDEGFSLVMLSPEPKEFSSDLKIETTGGREIQTAIEVNKPHKIAGWNIYQLSYDTKRGRWSDLSVLELVRDPWLPVVYAGVFMMMAGAGFLFIYGKPKNGGTENVA